MASENSRNDKETLFQNEKKVQFVPPPEAKVFYPTKEEFRDPLEYISKIRHIGETTGICKIVPPPSWKTPFSLDIEKFKFTARIQRLNMLDGKTRLKLNFMDQLFQFWDLQGIPLVVPEIGEKLLDCYELHKLTKGQHANVDGINWTIIAETMGLTSSENVVSSLKRSFEQILHPFIVFNGLCETESKDVKLKLEKEDEEKCEIETISLLDSEDEDNDVEVCEPAVDNDDENEKRDNTKPYVTRELKRLRFLGPGPKMNDSCGAKRRRVNKVNSFILKENTKYTCCGCGKFGDKSSILVCCNCRDKYHFSCIKPALESLPKSNWHCFKCTTLELTKPSEFGFEQSTEETELFEFGKMADQFKSDYFKLPAHMVTHESVENAYWDIASTSDKEVVVKYGADLHAVDNGSGFPTSNCINLQLGDVEYVNCGWNLNNLPILKNSLLRYISSDCSGMKIPWMYVGMCFATFCWHNEDHWMFSINYVHWGEPKVWYGIPGKDAEAFENVMKSELPELFDAQPDILHQLVTIMNPNILMKANVPVYKLVQNEGEFVITFPRAYHMGYNQGFNFAEAVNFAPVDWFEIGRKCVLHYAQVKRFCVFSHDELLCTIASLFDKLNPILASTIQSDLLYVVNREEKLRKNIVDDGVIDTQQVEFELFPDDKRHCEVCKTTCYVSAVSCSCNEEVLVCLEHYKDLCTCLESKKMLKYRYTVDELRALLTNVESVCIRYCTWLDKVQSTLAQSCGTPSPKLIDLLMEAETYDYPDCIIHKALVKAIAEA